ncbi:MAG: acylphosphatase, partial [Candidatus Bathycorpusculaceae bacterium]
MIRARIIAEGDVQKVGFRDLVQKVARRLGVKGYVENLRDGNVQILCEAEESILEGFIQGINVKEDFINVESVRVVEKCEATGEFEFFEIKHGELADELEERLGTAVEYARTTSRNIREMH